MLLSEWSFILAAQRAARDWFATWFEHSEGKVLFDFKDLHRDKDRNLVCLLEVHSPVPDLENVVFLCKETRTGAKVVAYQKFDITEGE